MGSRILSFICYSYAQQYPHTYILFLELLRVAAPTDQGVSATPSIYPEVALCDFPLFLTSKKKKLSQKGQMLRYKYFILFTGLDAETSL